MCFQLDLNMCVLYSYIRFCRIVSILPGDVMGLICVVVWPAVKWVVGAFFVSYIGLPITAQSSTTNCCQTSLLSAGHLQLFSLLIISAERKKTQFNSLPIIQMGVFSGSLLLVAFSSLNFPAPIQKPEWHERALFHHIHAIDSWMKYLFMKSKNMYSPLTLDSGNIDFWSTSPPPEPGPPVSQLWWLKGISASLFKCLLGPNFSSQTLFSRFCAENMKIVEAGSF